MSLNRAEQMVFDYVQTHVDERQFWVEKVQKTAARAADRHAAAFLLEGDLWSYFEERSAVASPFREEAQHFGIRRTSMKNLAEHLLRLWVPLPAKPKPHVPR